MVDFLSADKEFNMLSLLDLLEARDLYHIHLMHKANVVATAVGRYLIRHNDPWPKSLGDVKEIALQDQQHERGERTLDNSEVRPYSWPCIIVFVDKWVDRHKFGNEEHDSFVCVAGLLAHYVGDACQPLHVSHLHHGEPLPDDSEDVTKIKKEVHEVYETVMLDHYRSKGLGGEQDQERGLVDGINEALSGKKAKADVAGGHDAAVKVVRLMGETVETLPPQSIVNAYPLEGTQGERATALWKRFKHETISCMAAGCLRLASLWESAWKEGNGDQNVAAGDLAEVKQKELQKLYQNPKFLPSRPLKELKDLL